MFGAILTLYGLDESEYAVKPFGNGLINHTWKIISAGKEFLLQRINQQVFRKPADIMTNCSLLADFFKANYPDYLFVAPLWTTKHQNYVIDSENNYYRLFPFIKNSYTSNTVTSPVQAFEAAKQFGMFTRLLSNFDSSKLLITLPDFHNLALRDQQFNTALNGGNKQRLTDAAAAIGFLVEHKEIVDSFEKIKNNSILKQRVVHHDAKINNVLFDVGNHKSLCVIDLDTIMPGYYISDVGDMLRTYLPPVSEEEQDFSLIEVRDEYFRAIVQGYLGEMLSEFTEKELSYFVYAGKFAIYMQAIRFLTDYLQDDKYYNTQYKDQNLVRTKNQIELLKRYMEKESVLNDILKSS